MTVASQTGRCFSVFPSPAPSPKLHILKGKAFTTRRNKYLCYLLILTIINYELKGASFFKKCGAKISAILVFYHFSGNPAK